MQVKTTMSYHLTLIGMAIIKKILQIINAGKGVGKGNPLTLLVGMWIGVVTMENSKVVP